jgi:hypothetical protein
MCNPPGGDWSGLSVFLDGNEYRWLSLPRVSNNSKRPDHVSEMFFKINKPILFIIESKERGNDLEEDIGIRLKAYIEWLLSFSPSVYKNHNKNEWHDATEIVSIDHFELVSVGAYIDDNRYDNESILAKSKCDLLFLFNADETTVCWKLQILSNPKSSKGKDIKSILYKQLKNNKKGVQVID